MNKILTCMLGLLPVAVFAQQPLPPAGNPPPPPPDALQSYQPIGVPRFTVPVVAVTPAYQTQTRERKVCDRPQPSTGTSAAGTIIGGIAGGILGHQVGRGSGKSIATAAGAVGGAVVGNSVANGMDGTPNCQTVAEQSQVLVGYDVVYDFSGQRGQVRMTQRPGASIVVEVRPVGY